MSGLLGMVELEPLLLTNLVRFLCLLGFKGGSLTECFVGVGEQSSLDKK